MESNRLLRLLSSYPKFDMYWLVVAGSLPLWLCSPDPISRLVPFLKLSKGNWLNSSPTEKRDWVLKSIIFCYSRILLSFELSPFSLISPKDSKLGCFYSPEIRLWIPPRKCLRTPSLSEWFKAIRLLVLRRFELFCGVLAETIELEVWFGWSR